MAGFATGMGGEGEVMPRYLPPHMRGGGAPAPAGGADGSMGGGMGGCMGGAMGGCMGGCMGGGVAQGPTKIFVGSLPDDINETVLRAEFSKYGQIVDVYLKTGCEPNKQWAFVGSASGVARLGFDDRPPVWRRWPNVGQGSTLGMSGNQLWRSASGSQVKRDVPRMSEPYRPGQARVQSQPAL